MNSRTLLLAATLFAGAAFNTQAATITIGSVQRTASVTSAVSGFTGVSINPDGATVGGHLGGGTWTNAESLFTINFTTGNFNSNNVAGTWAIQPSFWAMYGNAAISMHVGQGSGDPDYFVFLVTPGETNGTFSYDRLSGGGGGFSNMKLWGNGAPSNTNTPGVPDSGSTVALLGLSVLGLGFLRRRLS
jgi:hypothetical protein